MLTGLVAGAVGGGLAAGFVPLFMLSMMTIPPSTISIAPAPSRVASREELVLVFGSVTAAAAVVGGVAGQLLVTPYFPEAAPE